MTAATANLRLLAGVREPVRLATTANIERTKIRGQWHIVGLPVVDGVQTVQGDRILVKDSDDAVWNGIWLASSGVWERAPDGRDKRTLNRGVLVPVQIGTANANTYWRVDTIEPEPGLDPIDLAIYLSGLTSTAIETVASNIASVNTAAANIANINIVAGISAQVTAVSLITTQVQAVAAIDDDIVTLAAVASSIPTLAAIDTEIATLGPIAAQLSYLYGIRVELLDVYDIRAAVLVNAALQTEIAALGAIPTAIVGVYNIRLEIEALAAIGAQIVTAAGISAQIVTVAGLSTQITALGARTTEIDALYAELATIVTKVGASANIPDGHLVVGDGGGKNVKAHASGAPGDAAFKNTGTTAGTLAAGDDSRIVAAIPGAMSPSGDDLNNATDEGVYRVTGSTTNTPAGTGPSGSSVITTRWNSTTIKQIFISHSGKFMHVRRCVASVWSSWSQILESGDIGSVVQGYDADTLKGDVADQTITGGTRITSYDLNGGSAVTSGTITPDPGDRPKQRYTNGGAHTLAPPTQYGFLELTIVNNASAGAITTSGFTKVVGSFTTTNGHKFKCYISSDADGSLLTIQALQ